MTLFSRHIGIDYSGAALPTRSCTGLRVYVAAGAEAPAEVLPPGRRGCWSRQGLAEWLVAELRVGPRTLVGIDHAFSFPLAYFDQHGLVRSWHAFLDDFCAHWPTDAVTVESVRRGEHGQGALRGGNSRWRRKADVLAGGAKSPFHFDVQGSVAKSTHAGLPWLRYMRDELKSDVHFWPFDGWRPPAAAHVVAEIYPSLWRARYPRSNRTPDQQDAYTACRWLNESDRAGSLAADLAPDLPPEYNAAAAVEGWILGVQA